jgi:putative addiction module component (TIGR02574 family)
MRIEQSQPLPSELLNAVLSLPVSARAALIDSLLESLDPDAADIDVNGNLHEDWRSEIRSRVQQIEDGTVNMIPWDEARQALRSRLPR